MKKNKKNTKPIITVADYINQMMNLTNENTCEIRKFQNIADGLVMNI